jgi:hypothetical protein
MLKDEYQHKLDGKGKFFPLCGMKAHAQVPSIVQNICHSLKFEVLTVVTLRAIPENIGCRFLLPTGYAETCMYFAVCCVL